MAIAESLPMSEPLRKAPWRERAARAVRVREWLNRYAAKALGAADIILSSIPAAAVAAEIKDVALLVIQD
jgi:hypothetical protein